MGSFSLKHRPSAAVLPSTVDSSLRLLCWLHPLYHPWMLLGLCITTFSLRHSSVLEAYPPPRCGMSKFLSLAQYTPEPWTHTHTCLLSILTCMYSRQPELKPSPGGLGSFPPIAAAPSERLLPGVGITSAGCPSQILRTIPNVSLTNTWMSSPFNISVPSPLSPSLLHLSFWVSFHRLPLCTLTQMPGRSL